MNSVENYLRTPIRSCNQLVSMSGVAWNETNLSGRNTARFTEKKYVGMREHFNKVHISSVTKRAQDKFARYRGVMVMINERNKRGRIARGIEAALTHKLNTVPEQFILRLYNPMNEYRSFTKVSLLIEGRDETVYFLEQGRGAGAQIVYVHKTGPWIRESALLRLKRLMKSPSDVENMPSCRKHIRDMEQVLINSEIPFTERSFTIANRHDYGAALEDMATKAINLLSIHNQEASRR